MQGILSIIEKIAPDIMETLSERHRILRNIYLFGPIGRRVLADKMNITERVLRTEVDFLRMQNLVETSKQGMVLTPNGEDTYRELDYLMHQLMGMREKEATLAKHFQVQHCVIVSGNMDEQVKVKKELGHATVDALNSLLPDGENIIAVMGGGTMAEVANHMNKGVSQSRSLLFVPARGGLGEAVEIQANSVAAKMAEMADGKNRVLYVPEHVSEETYKPLLQEPNIKQTLDLVSNANCVLYGIGDAIRMAERRGMSDDALALIKKREAVGEAFGEFYNQSGEVVYKISRIGMQSKDLVHVPVVIAIAGGKSKADAIAASMKQAPAQTWLITDEGAANQILKGITL